MTAAARRLWNDGSRDERDRVKLPPTVDPFDSAYSDAHISPARTRMCGKMRIEREPHKNDDDTEAAVAELNQLAQSLLYNHPNCIHHHALWD